MCLFVNGCQQLGRSLLAISMLALLAFSRQIYIRRGEVISPSDRYLLTTNR